MDFPCTSCNQLLKRKDTLRDHTKRFHPNSDDESIKCLECEKLFSRIFDLKKYTSKYHKSSCQSISEHKETDKDVKSPEYLNNSETREEFRKHLNIESNNEGENPLISYEEMMHEQIEYFESTKKLVTPKQMKTLNHLKN